MNPDIIIPDIQTTIQLDGPNQVLPHSEAILEVKGMRFSPTHYRSSENERSTDRRGDKIRKEYASKAKMLDDKYGQGINPPPFRTALASFYSGNAIPICFGAFGEFNKGTDKFLYRLAEAGARTDEGLGLSPFPDRETGQGQDKGADNFSGRTGPRRILLRKYRTALNCMAVRVNADLKSKRTQFIRDTYSGAINYAKSCKDQYSSNNRTGPTWFNGGRNETYHALDSFVQGNRNDYVYA